LISGVNIICKKQFGQWLITNNPYCVINDLETRWLFWNRMSFIPLQPGVMYFFQIQFRYLGGNIGVARFSVMVQPGEVQVFEYQSPWVIGTGGTIRRLQ
jgi:hypothetical protein